MKTRIGVHYQDGFHCHSRTSTTPLKRLSRPVVSPALPDETILGCCATLVCLLALIVAHLHQPVKVQWLCREPDSRIPIIRCIRYNEPELHIEARGPLEEEQIISLKEAAARFGISHSHLQWLARKGRLKAKKLGRDWFTTPDAVAEYLANVELRSKHPYKYKHT